MINVSCSCFVVLLVKIYGHSVSLFHCPPVLLSDILDVRVVYVMYNQCFYNWRNLNVKNLKILIKPVISIQFIKSFTNPMARYLRTRQLLIMYLLVVSLLVPQVTMMTWEKRKRKVLGFWFVLLLDEDTIQGSSGLQSIVHIFIF